MFIFTPDLPRCAVMITKEQPGSAVNRPATPKTHPLRVYSILLMMMEIVVSHHFSPRCFNYLHVNRRVESLGLFTRWANDG